MDQGGSVENPCFNLPSPRDHLKMMHEPLIQDFDPGINVSLYPDVDSASPLSLMDGFGGL
jgi:hypothetical protein